MFLWTQIGVWVFAHLGGIGFTEENFAAFQDGYNRYGFWIVFTCGFTPLPYKVITITAGACDIHFGIFLIASSISRSARFFLVSGLFWWFGPTIKPLIDKYFNWLAILFTILLIGGFVVIKYLF